MCKRRQGFTIVECLIAGVILAGFAAAIAAGVAQSAHAARRGEDQRLAADHLEDVLNRVDLIGPARVASEGPVEGTLGERFGFTLDVYEDEVNLDLYHVTATVSCPTPSGGTQSVTAYTQLFDPVGSRATVASWEELE